MSDEPTLATIAATLARLEAQQGAAHIQRRKDVEDAHAVLEGLRTALDTLRGDVMARMDRLDNRLAEIRGDITVGMGAAMQARRVNDNTRDELKGLSETVEAIQRQIALIQTDIADIRGEAG